MKEIRLKVGISQNVLATKAGLSRGAFQLIEKGIRNPTLLTSHAIASALNVSLAAVLALTEKAPRGPEHP